jgi:hypothetical protein
MSESLIVWVVQTADGGCCGVYSSLHHAFFAAHDDCLVPKLMDETSGETGWPDCSWEPIQIDDMQNTSMVRWELRTKADGTLAATVRAYKVDEYLNRAWTDYD